MKVPRLVMIAVLASLFLPAFASAQDVAPPGNSAVDQYRESAPPASPGSKKLSGSRKRALDAEGRDGAALAAVLEKNGGIPSAKPSGGAASGASPSSGGASSGGKGSEGSGSGGSSSSGDPGVASAGSPAAGPESKTDAPSEKKTSTTDAAASSTVGPLPVWAMLIAAVVVVGIGLVVRRRPSA
ncbi:hypothetical protein AB0L40_11810 [Patulibacter sp. NPDC049589]|uniref:hypothetical protein n=1 Tax=Patulibacter sp. NPDC049589 TaxID=3154731 RepID=UPI0034385600